MVINQGHEIENPVLDIIGQGPQLSKWTNLKGERTQNSIRQYETEDKAFLMWREMDDRGDNRHEEEKQLSNKQQLPVLDDQKFKVLQIHVGSQ